MTAVPRSRNGGLACSATHQCPPDCVSANRIEEPIFPNSSLPRPVSHTMSACRLVGSSPPWLCLIGRLLRLWGPTPADSYVLLPAGSSREQEPALTRGLSVAPSAATTLGDEASRATVMSGHSDQPPPERPRLSAGIGVNPSIPRAHQRSSSLPVS